MTLRLQNFDFVVEYKKGTLVLLAYTLVEPTFPHSHMSRSGAQKRMSLLQWMLDPSLRRRLTKVDTLNFVSISPQSLARVQQATEADSEMVLLKSIIQSGWPDTRDEVPHRLKGYFGFIVDLSARNGVVIKDEQI